MPARRPASGATRRTVDRDRRPHPQPHFAHRCARRAVGRDVNPAGAVDAIVVASFGGPEGPEDVMPFLENVTRGRNVPPERLLDVAEHYYALGDIKQALGRD